MSLEIGYIFKSALHAAKIGITFDAFCHRVSLMLASTSALTQTQVKALLIKERVHLVFSQSKGG